MVYNPLVHNRRSIRLPGYDYAQLGAYFLTLCCHGRQCFFGNIINGEMHLNQAGIIAQNTWLKTQQIRPMVELGPFVFMPNHFHGIIFIRTKGNPHLAVPENEPMSDDTDDTDVTEFSSPKQTVGAVIRGFKAAVTRQLKEQNLAEGPVWQRNYYEHIIRDEESYQRIAEYIENNPTQWHTDKLFRS